MRSSVSEAKVAGLISRWMVSPHLSWSPMVPFFLPPALTMSVPLITSKNRWMYLQTHNLYIKTTLCTCPSNTVILNIKRKSFYLYFILGCTSEYTIVIMGLLGSWRFLNPLIIFFLLTSYKNCFCWCKRNINFLMTTEYTYLLTFFPLFRTPLKCEQKDKSRINA